MSTNNVAGMGSESGLGKGREPASNTVSPGLGRRSRSDGQGSRGRGGGGCAKVDGRKRHAENTSIIII